MLDQWECWYAQGKMEHLLFVRLNKHSILVECNPHGVNLAHLQIYKQGTFGNFEFRKSVFPWVLIIAAVFFGLSDKCCNFNCFILSTVFFDSNFIHEVLQ